MRKSCFASLLALATALALVPGAVLAQQTDEVTQTDIPSSRTSGTNTSSKDRLYINFVEDAMVVDEQWWEGWLQYDDADFINRTVLFGRAAFQPWENVEIGGSIGIADIAYHGTNMPNVGWPCLPGCFSHQRKSFPYHRGTFYLAESSQGSYPQTIVLAIGYIIEAGHSLEVNHTLRCDLSLLH